MKILYIICGVVTLVMLLAVIVALIVRKLNNK